MKKILTAAMLLTLLYSCKQFQTGTQDPLRQAVLKGVSLKMDKDDHLDTLYIIHIDTVTEMQALTIEEDTLKKDIVRLDTIYERLNTDKQTAVTALAMLKHLEGNKKYTYHKLMVDTLIRKVEKVKTKEAREKDALDSLKFAALKADTVHLQAFAVTCYYQTTSKGNTTKKDNIAHVIISKDYKLLGDEHYFKAISYN
jgi:hypothetical protein